VKAWSNVRLITVLACISFGFIASEAEGTVYYAEHQSSGPGGNTSERVSWSRQLTEDEAERYAVERLLESTTHPGWYRR